MRKFKVGDKVKLIKRKVSQQQLDDNGSTGVFGKIYTIAEIERYIVGENLKFAEANWHFSYWVQLARPNSLIGGRLI